MCNAKKSCIKCQSPTCNPDCKDCSGKCESCAPVGSGSTWAILVVAVIIGLVAVVGAVWFTVAELGEDESVQMVDDEAQEEDEEDEEEGEDVDEDEEGENDEEAMHQGVIEGAANMDDFFIGTTLLHAEVSEVLADPDTRCSRFSTFFGATGESILIPVGAPEVFLQDLVAYAGSPDQAVVLYDDLIDYQENYMDLNWSEICATSSDVYVTWFDEKTTLTVATWDAANASNPFTVLASVGTLDRSYFFAPESSLGQPLIVTGYGDAGTYLWKVYGIDQQVKTADLLESCQGTFYDESVQDFVDDFSYSCTRVAQ